MTDKLDPAVLNFTITLAMYVLIAFGIMITGAVVTYSIMVWRGISPARASLEFYSKPTFQK